MKIIDYKILQGHHADLFEKLVVEYIGWGWAPYGFPYGVKNNHCQAFVKYEEAVEKEPMNLETVNTIPIHTPITTAT